MKDFDLPAMEIPSNNTPVDMNGNISQRAALVALAALAFVLLSFPFAVQGQTDRPNVLHPTAQAKSKPKPKASSATNVSSEALAKGESPLDQTSRLPNVLILFADDLGHGDVSYNGGDIPTPHIDALVADGVRFTAGYMTAPLCNPGRRAGRSKGAGFPPSNRQLARS